MNPFTIITRLLGRLFNRRTEVPEFRPPRPLDRRARRTARRNARSSYAGPPSGESYAAHQLQALHSLLVHIFRNDQEVSAARAVLSQRAYAVADATAEMARITAETAAALAAARGVPATTSDPADTARWQAGVRAHAEETAGREALRAARAAEVEAQRELDRIGTNALDRLVDAASAGVVHINAYLAVFNQERDHRGRAGIGLLDDDIVEELVRRAVRRVDVSDAPATEAPAADRPDADTGGAGVAA